MLWCSSWLGPFLPASRGNGCGWLRAAGGGWRGGFWPTRGDFAISAKQILLASRGAARLSRLNQNDNGQTIINETTNEERSSTFPITEIAADINFFWDHSTRINLGYAYSHWNFYEIQGFGRSNFQDLSFSGPRLSLNYHF